MSCPGWRIFFESTDHNRRFFLSAGSLLDCRAVTGTDGRDASGASGGDVACELWHGDAGTPYRMASGSRMRCCCGGPESFLLVAEVFSPLTLAAGRCYKLTHFGRLAQLGEHRPYKPRVTGSIPVSPTKEIIGVRSFIDLTPFSHYSITMDFPRSSRLICSSLLFSMSSRYRLR